MATERLLMRDIRQILRLRWDAKKSVRETAASVGLSTGVVGKCTARAKAAGLDWPAVEALGDDALERKLYGEKASPDAARPEPDPARMHIELKRDGVTLELLHIEYLAQHPQGLQYTAFCERYRAWKRRHRLTMRQGHKAGEKMFVDFSGKRPMITDRVTGEQIAVELFVAVLGASSYTFVEAARTQRVEDWVRLHDHAVSYFGGVAEVWVPDCLKSGVTRADWYEPTIQRTYRDQAQHYGAVVIPARPRRPRDKAKVEVAVQVAQRWILARLRHETFFTLEDLNERIRVLCDALNARPRRHLGGVSRRELFERIERAALARVPEATYEPRSWKSVRANADYHVQIGWHWYSVPYALAHEELEVCLTATTVELLHRGTRVAAHVRSAVEGGFTTDAAHRPANHRAWAERDPGGLLAWAEQSGPNTTWMMKRILESNIHRDQTWRSGRALMRMGETYGAARTEVACERALRHGARSYKPIERMLRLEMDLRPDPTAPAEGSSPIAHDQIRGPDYYVH